MLGLVLGPPSEGVLRACLGPWWAALNVAPARSLSPIFLFGQSPRPALLLLLLLSVRDGLVPPDERWGLPAENRAENERYEAKQYTASQLFSRFMPRFHVTRIPVLS